MTLVPASSHGGSGSSTSVQDADPGGAAGAGWLNTTDPGSGIPSNVRPLLVRNAAGTGWDEVQTIHRDAAGLVRGFLTFSDDGMVMQLITATPAVVGEWYFFHSGDAGYSNWLVNSPGGRIQVKIDANGNFAFGIQAIGQGDILWGAAQEGIEQFKASTTPADPGTNLRKQWYDATAGAPKLRFANGDAAGTVTSGWAESASPITSGALPTQQLVSGTGAQLLVARAVESVTPITFNPGAATTATCTVALSPDNVTYSTLGIETEPVGVAFDGTIHLVKVRVPAGWYLKLTVNAQAVLGLTTYY